MHLIFNCLHIISGYVGKVNNLKILVFEDSFTHFGREIGQFKRLFDLTFVCFDGLKLLFPILSNIDARESFVGNPN